MIGILVKLHIKEYHDLSDQKPCGNLVVEHQPFYHHKLPFPFI